MSFLGLKVLHFISIVGWFAGLFFIFRLFITHRQNSHDENIVRVLSIMEGRIIKFIIFPASLVAFGSGFILVGKAGYFPVFPGWIAIKIFLVSVLGVYEGLAWHTYQRFAAGEYFLTVRACRIINVVPTLMLVIIAYVSIFKPW